MRRVDYHFFSLLEIYVHVVVIRPIQELSNIYIHLAGLTFINKYSSSLLSPEGVFLAQNAPKIVCRPGMPGPAGELTALPQTPQLDLRGPTSKEGEGKAGEGGEGRRGE